MSSEQNDETQNQVNRWLEAILPGKKDNGTEVGTELDSPKVYDATRHAFYKAIKANQKLRTYSIDCLKGDQSLLNRSRKKLGQWYSAIIYADLLSYRSKNPDSEEHLQQRMQALLREALVWFPDAIFAQVILHCRSEDEGGMKECTAVAGERVNGESLGEVPEVFRSLTADYAKMKGTTVSLDIHLRHGNRWTYFKEGHKILEPRFGSSEKTVDPRDVHIYPLPIATFYPGEIGSGHGGQASANQEEERSFFKDVAKNALEQFRLCKTAFNFGMLHIAQGVDVVFDDDEDNTTVCHLYVMAYTSTKDRPVIDPLYYAAMKNLLSKLAHFHSIHRMLTRQAELEKNKQMMDLLIGPLNMLTDTLQQTQEKAQELRSILYEPAESIFGVQKAIASLFQDGGSIENPDGSSVKVCHKTDNYDKLKDVRWVLAHALARFRGKQPEGKNAQEALEREAFGLQVASSDASHPFHHLSVAVARLIGYNKNSPQEVVSADLTNSINYLANLKKRLFSPFKPDEALLAMDWPMLNSLLPSKVCLKHVCVNNNIAKNYAIDCDDLFVIVANSNPLATSGHLLSFLATTVAYAASNSSSTISVSVSTHQDGFSGNGWPAAPTSAKLVFSLNNGKKWITDETSGKLLHEKLLKERSIREQDCLSIGEHGDFHRPFVTLIRRCLKDSLPAIYYREERLSLIWARFEISFCDSLFEIVSGGVDCWDWNPMNGEAT